LSPRGRGKGRAGLGGAQREGGGGLVEVRIRPLAATARLLLKVGEPPGGYLPPPLGSAKGRKLLFLLRFWLNFFLDPYFFWVPRYPLGGTWPDPPGLKKKRVHRSLGAQADTVFFAPRGGVLTCKGAPRQRPAPGLRTLRDREQRPRRCFGSDESDGNPPAPFLGREEFPLRQWSGVQGEGDYASEFFRISRIFPHPPQGEVDPASEVGPLSLFQGPNMLSCPPLKLALNLNMSSWSPDFFVFTSLVKLAHYHLFTARTGPSWPRRSWPVARTSRLGRGQLPPGGGLRGAHVSA